MEISAGWVSAGAAVLGLVGGGLIRWIHGSLKDESIARNAEIVAVKGTQKTIFDKHDNLVQEVQEYKLHVAESYVNREVLREQLAPINETLRDIQQELRDERHK